MNIEASATLGREIHICAYIYRLKAMIYLEGPE